MNYKEIQAIIKNFEKSNMTTLELTTEGFSIKLSKLEDTVIKQDSIKHVEEFKNVEPTIDEANHFELKSPLVGTFYASNSPDAKPFVQVGDTVKEKQTLCIIEAMKIMNEITWPINGTIKSINVKNGDAIGFDEVIMVIE